MNAYKIDQNYTINAYGKYSFLVQQEFPDGTFKKKVVAVEPDSEYSFKLLKTKIKANDGAEGLYRFITTACRDNVMMDYVYKILSWVMNSMKEKK